MGKGGQFCTWSFPPPPPSCTHAHAHAHMHMHMHTALHIQMFTLSDVVSAASLETVTEGLRSVDGMEAAADSLRTAAGWGGAVVTTEALTTAA